MTLRRILKILSGLLLLFIVSVGLTSIRHPIILKWVTGSATHFGKPMSATVYTNGQVNRHIKVFYGDNGHDYLLCITAGDPSGTRKFFNINLDEKWIGSPAGMSEHDHDLIGGHLFLTKTGGHFSPVLDNTTGFNFDPRFSIMDRQINFKMPPGLVQFDSVRIEMH